MSKGLILVVDDEEDIRELIRYSLQKENYAVAVAENGEDALKQARGSSPHLVILDLMLPGIDGLEVCRIMKADPATSAIPIVMLTAKGDEADVVAGLELGADDYMTKPFSPRVLLARMKAVLRRRQQRIPAEDEVIHMGDLTIHPGTREVTAVGKPVDVTSTEFRILHYLAQRPGWVFTRDQIVNVTQSDSTPVTGRTVDVHIASLRKKLGEHGDCIETVRGVGYRFKDLTHE